MITNVLQPIECYIETQFYAKQVLVPVYPFFPFQEFSKLFRAYQREGADAAHTAFSETSLNSAIIGVNFILKCSFKKKKKKKGAFNRSKLRTWPGGLSPEVLGSKPAKCYQFL